MKSKKIIAALALVSMLFSTVGSFAADRDFWKKSPEKLFATKKQMAQKKTLRATVSKTPKNYYFEANGHLFEMDYVNEAFAKNPEGFLADLKVEKAVKPVNEKFKVVSVSAINGKTIEVKFNKKVDKANAELPGKYSVKKIKDSAVNAVASAKLQKDEMTVHVTVAAVLDGEYLVTVEPISAAELPLKTELFTQTISFKDTERPTFKEVLYPAPGEAELVFSEELSSAGTVKVKPEGPTSSLKEGKILLSGLKSGKEYEVSVETAKDHSGNLISPNPFTVKVKNEILDGEEPVVESVKANGLNELVIKFSEPIKDLGSSVFATINIDGVALVGATQKFDKEKSELTVQKTPIAAAGVHNVEVSAFKDLAGNDGQKKSFNLKFEDVAVYQKAEVVDASKKVKLIFSAVPTKAGAGDLDLSRLDSNGVTYTVTIPNAQMNAIAADKALELTLAGAAAFEPGEYTATLPKTLVTNLDKDTPIAFTVAETPDNEKPKVVGVTVTKETVTVLFSKSMNDEAKTIANYAVEGDSSVFTSAIFDGNRATVKLTLKEGVYETTADRTLTISNLSSLAGVAMDTYSKAENFKDNVLPTVDETKTVFVGPKTVNVVFSEKVKYNGTDYVEVYVGGVKVALDGGTLPTNLNAGATEATITLAAAVTEIKPITLKFVKDLKDDENNVLDKSKTYNVKVN